MSILDFTIVNAFMQARILEITPFRGGFFEKTLNFRHFTQLINSKFFLIFLKNSPRFLFIFPNIPAFLNPKQAGAPPGPPAVKNITLYLSILFPSFYPSKYRLPLRLPTKFYIRQFKGLRLRQYIHIAV